MKPLVALVSVAMLAGCVGGSHSDLEDWMKIETAGITGKIEPLPLIKPFEPFEYQAFNQVDPFSTGKLDISVAGGPEGAKGVKPDAKCQKAVEDRAPLSSRELDQLRMVGTLSRGGIYWGLVKSATDNSLYQVKTGDCMGANFGKVVSVEEGEIKLIEVVPGSDRQLEERPASLMLIEEEQKK